jgi:hypothetical protein
MNHGQRVRTLPVDFSVNESLDGRPSTALADCVAVGIEIHHAAIGRTEVAEQHEVAITPFRVADNASDASASPGSVPARLSELEHVRASGDRR